MAKKVKPLKKGRWSLRTDLQDFIYQNINPYEGDSSFLKGPTKRTVALWRKVENLYKKERTNGGVLDIDTEVAGGIISHKAGYIDRKNELITGLQTDKPLRRAVKPIGGVRLVEKACEAHGFKLSPKLKEVYTKFRKSHNEAVFNVYSDEMKKIRTLGVITGLPDSYARGRIIGDYRRVALYGLDYLIKEKEKDFNKIDDNMSTMSIRLREEVGDQLKALKEMIILGKSYGFDLTRPAKTAKEAIQWTYLAYLAAAKESDGAAMSIGPISVFFDVYIERDIKAGILTEEKAQELVDDFTIKLRLIRQLRAPEYDLLFAGDPVWVTIVLGGMTSDGRTKVTKTDFRF